MLDDDAAGRRAKTKYTDDYMLDQKSVVTLGDISSGLQGKKFEAILKRDVIDQVKYFFNIEKPKKSHCGIFFQSLIATPSKLELTMTEQAFQPIRGWVAARFEV